MSVNGKVNTSDGRRTRPIVGSGLMAIIVLTSSTLATAQSPNVVISQIYGGGGASAGTPTFDQDYIELHNRGTAVVDLSTWSVQYADAVGTTWSKTDLTGVILPGQYVLVGGAIGTAGGPLPVAVDVNGAIDLSATTGKVALVNNQNVLPSQPCFNEGASGVVDLVGYGQGENGTNCAESAPTPVLSDSTAAFRVLDGCRDKNINVQDFLTAAPLPRNSASEFSACIPYGACCTEEATRSYCVNTTANDCAGTYLGDYSACGPLNYNLINSPNSPLIDISQTGTPGPAQGHNVLSDVIDLPFPINVYETPRTQFRYSTNGWLTFDLTQTDSAPSNPATLPNADSPNLVVAPLWDEFVSDASGPNRIFMQTIGTAPNRQFILQYNNVLKFNTSTRYTFQVILSEGLDEFNFKDRIEFRYSQFTTPDAGDAVIGIEDLAGQTGRIRALSAITVGAAVRSFSNDGNRCFVRGCCFGTSCQETNSVSCQRLGGVVDSQASSCEPSPCTSGACCLNDGTCQIRSPLSCATENGTYRGDDTDCQGPCPPLGACCAADGSGACNIRTQEFCIAGGGSWAGPGSTCVPGNCTGACCQTDGTCADTGEINCQNTGGTFHGVGTTCATLNPPCPPGGACCVPDGSGCSMRTEMACIAQGGLWDGPGSNCFLGACKGACCHPQGICITDFNRSTCESNGGIFHGVHVACADVNPSCPGTQLCCKPDGTCANLTPFACAAQGGAPDGPGTFCNQVSYGYSQITPNFVEISQTGSLLIGHGFDDHDAPFDIGFPFYFHAGCQAKTAGRVGVNGLITFTGAATEYRNGNIPHWEAPNDAIYVLWDDLYTHLGDVWVQTVGDAPNRVCIVEWKNVVLRDESILDPMTFQCKIFEGTDCIEFHYAHLATTGRSATTGVENENGSAATRIPDASLGSGPIAFRLCPPRVGACCLNDGTCELLLESVCNNRGGDYRGDDTDCETAACDPFGSCCAGDASGNCNLRTEADCNQANGSWGGAGSTCSPNPCTGACCIPGGQCQDIGPIPCFNFGGVFMSTGTSCATLDPPCSQIGACCSLEGSCELRFDFNCGTYFQGPGTVCSAEGACQSFAQIDGQDVGCPGEEYTLTVTISGGVPPYTVTLDNDGGTQTGNSPLQFIVSPTATTVYSIASAFDSQNQPIQSSESVEIFIPTEPDCNANGGADWCERLDIEQFVTALLEYGSSPDDCLADLNANGSADGQDLQIYVILLLQ